MRGRRQGSKKTTSLSKWLVMRMKMDGINVSLCHSSWSTSLGCPAGEYEFIEVITEDKNHAGPVRLIVDIDFRSQFELARPLQHYKELTDSLHLFLWGLRTNSASWRVSLSMPEGTPVKPPHCLKHTEKFTLDQECVCVPDSI